MSCGNPEGAVEGEEKEEVLMPTSRPVRRVDKAICNRCKKAKTSFIFRQGAYCSPCYEISLRSRFIRQLHPPLRPGAVKSTLTLYRPVVQSGQALIAVSGGAGSVAMLDMLMSRGYISRSDGAATNRTKGQKEAVWDKATVVYVEFASVTGRDERTEDIRKLSEDRGLGFIGLKVEDVYDAGLVSWLGGSERNADTSGVKVNFQQPNLPVSQEPTTSNTTPVERLQSLLASLPPASRPSLLSHILDHLLTLAALTLPNVSQLLLGETATRLAQRVISGTALGRGWTLPLELSNSFTLPDSQIVRMKPMKEISVKEAALWCRIHGLETVNYRGWDDVGPKGKEGRAKGGAASLEALTEQFIAGLSTTHPSTVSTINRTGDKLVFPGDTSGPICPLCEMPTEPDAMRWKARTALTSLTDPHSSLGSPTIAGIHTGDSTHDNFAPTLCYACLTTLSGGATDRTTGDGMVNLPPWVGQRVSTSQRMVAREQMREEIADFLLATEEE